MADQDYWDNIMGQEPLPDLNYEVGGSETSSAFVPQSYGELDNSLGMINLNRESARERLAQKYLPDLAESDVLPQKITPILRRKGVTPETAWNYLRSDEGTSPGRSAGDAYFDYGRYGFTREEVNRVVGQGIAQESGMEPPDSQQFTGSDIRQQMNRYLQEEFGGEVPTGKGKGVHPAAWTRTPGTKRAQAQLSQPFRDPETGEFKPPSEAKYTPSNEWSQGYVSRGQATSEWPSRIYTKGWLGVPGKESGTIRVPERWQKDEKGELKLAKRTQMMRGSYETPEAYHTDSGQKVTHKAPIGSGYGRDVGMNVPITYLAKELLPEGMAFTPKEERYHTTRRATREFFVPKGEKLAGAAEVGQHWESGQSVELFEGAAPSRIGLDRTADWADVVGHETKQITNDKGVEGTMHQWQLELGASDATSRLQWKTGATKAITARADTEKMLGYGGYSVATIKEASSLAGEYWKAHPEQMASHLEMSQEELQGKQWTDPDIGLNLSQEFHRRMGLAQAGEGKKSWDLEVGKQDVWLTKAHGSQLPMFGKGVTEEAVRSGNLPDEIKETYNISPIEGEDRMYDVTAKNATTIKSTWFKQLRQGYGVSKQNVPYRELKDMRRHAPKVYEQVMKESERPRQAYFGVMGAALANEGGRTMPTGTISPTKQALQNVIGAAEAKAQAAVEKYDQYETVQDLPDFYMERAVMEQATEAFGGHALELGGKVFADPQHAQYFSTEGGRQGVEASGYGRAYGRAIMEQFGTEEDAQAAVERLEEKQGELASGRNFLQSAMRAHTSRVVAGWLLMS